MNTLCGKKTKQVANFVSTGFQRVKLVSYFAVVGYKLSSYTGDRAINLYRNPESLIENI
jgi:hypothetical protein